MPEDVVNCPLCGSPKKKVFDQRKFRDQPVTNQLCLSCGLVFQSPRMNTWELDAFYQQEYRQLYQGSAGPSAKDLAIQNNRAQALLELLATDRLEITRHLDIGCSAGALLEAFVNTYGCLPVGVEPGEAYRKYATGRNLIVYPSLEALEEAGEAYFDFISLAHVLEHLPDPVESLAGLREKWLMPQGHLLVEVPNLYCHDSFEVAHLVSYSPQTLTQTLTNAGYRIIHLWTHGRPRSRLLPLYITALAVPGELPAFQEVHPERWVTLKRRAGLLHRGLLSRLLPRQAWLPAGQGVEA